MSAQPKRPSDSRIAAIAVLFGVYLSWTAGRIDRLHARVEAARAVLDAQLLRRSGAALDVATGGLFDPASAVLGADAATPASTAAVTSSIGSDPSTVISSSRSA